MKKYILGLGAIMFAVALAFGMSAFKTTNKKPKFDSYRFEYVSGDASIPSNWVFTTSPAECQGNGESCTMSLFSPYVNTNTTPVSIKASALPNGTSLPVVTGTGSNKVPDPAYQGTVYELISNQTP
jgi:hypothetical protein